MVERCKICGVSAEKHHIITRGAFGSDNPANIIWLCRKHHTECHAKGRITFFSQHGLNAELEAALEQKYKENRGEA